MTTRDIGHGHTQQSNLMTPTPIYSGGQTYYQLVACDGWPSGPCPSPAKAIERVTAYERCEEVSEAAPQQASRAQMKAFLEWGNSLGGGTPPLRPTYGAVMRDVGGHSPNYGTQPSHVSLLASNAIRDGLHSQAWMAASAELVRLAGTRELPGHVLNAGGTMTRRRLPDTQIPTRGA